MYHQPALDALCTGLCDLVVQILDDGTSPQKQRSRHLPQTSGTLSRIYGVGVGRVITRCTATSKARGVLTARTNHSTKISVQEGAGGLEGDTHAALHRREPDPRRVLQGKSAQ